MPKRDTRLLIEDMAAAIAKIQRYVAEIDKDRFLKDDKTIDAVVRNLEILGEACRQMPEVFKDVHTSIPWPQIAGLRNRIVHDYFGVDLELIWQIVMSEIPNLKQALAALD